MALALGALAAPVFAANKPALQPATSLDFSSRGPMLSLGMQLGELSQTDAWRVTCSYTYELAGNVTTMGQSGQDALCKTSFNVQNSVYVVTLTLRKGSLPT